MKLNLALIQPYIDTLNVALNVTEIEGVKHFSATVIDISAKGVHLQLGDDVSARLPFEGDVTVKPGSTILFKADGEIVEVVIPAAPARQQAVASTRSPNKAADAPQGKANY